MFEDQDTQQQNTKPRPPQPNPPVPPSFSNRGDEDESLKIDNLNNGKLKTNINQIEPDLPEDIFAGYDSDPDTEDTGSGDIINQDSGEKPDAQEGNFFNNSIAGKNSSLSGQGVSQTLSGRESKHSPPGNVSSDGASNLPDYSSPQRKALVFILSAFIVALLFIGVYLVYRIFKAREKVVIYNQPIQEAYIKPNTSQEDLNNKTSEEKNLENLETSKQNQVDASKQNQADEGSRAVEENKEKEESVSDSAKIDNIDDSQVESTDQNKQSEDSTESNQSPPLDTDNDGLSDLEELQIGSNPRVIDTDLDGLDDYSEVKIYNSNPVKRDTDGDGYDDGTEVENGYSPTGPGKL